jgi:hypothetical protein
MRPYNISFLNAVYEYNWGTGYLTRENLEVVLAEFSTLSWTGLFQSNVTEWQANSHV